VAHFYQEEMVTPMPDYKEKRRLNRSVKLSSETYERLMSLQGFLQLKERRKRSMDELIEFMLSFIPDMEIKADESYYALRSRPTKRAP
jgi:spermidine synthase